MTERELIRDVRRQLVGMGCGCYRLKGQLCSACILLKMIDDGLAEIGQTDKEVMAEVVNIRDRPDWEAEGGVYIGRAVRRLGLKLSMFANPYIEGKDGNRDEVIEKYCKWFYGRLGYVGFPEAVEALRGKMLVCWCAPADCHGRIIKEYLEGGSDGVTETD